MNRKRQAANWIMVAVIALMAAAGLVAAGSVLGWFGGEADHARIADIRGVVNLERSGVAYPLEAEMRLRQGDRITCTPGATAVIQGDTFALALGGGAEVEVQQPEEERFLARVEAGECFVNARGALTLTIAEKTLEFEDAAALLSVRGGAQTLTVLDGTVADAQAGEAVSWVGRDRTTAPVSLQALNDFAIGQIRIANRSRQLWVTDEALDEMEAQRTAAIADQLAPGGDGAHCTIAIYCDTILDNRERLDVAKAGYVPEDGVILSPVAVELQGGETVFDVLKRVCDAYAIDLEYSWTPLYDSYYIEGIHQLYEFDCGPQSGWMYKVNEWFPNYGCSEYTLSGGESIVWCYTCNGLGEDVGGGAY